jgi:murein DD-endopeptidase MepM/ murein hydrolase activator NlpD
MIAFQKHSESRILHSAIISVFFWVLPAASFSSQVDAAVQWHLLFTQIRDSLISKTEAQVRLRSLEKELRDLYPKESHGKAETPLCFPLEGYGSNAIGGKAGSGYQVRGYDFFDGNRHKGHPGHDLFIRDKDLNGIDDVSGKAANVISASSGVVVSVNLGWEPSSPIRGGNYVWIYEPEKSRYYYYAHLQEVWVSIGQMMAGGDRIGTVGRTGKNACPERSPTHLHFSVHQSADGYPKPINPYQELRRGGCRKKTGE